jgi:hypothetical protein
VPKDWEVKLGVVGDVFFNLSKNQRIGSLLGTVGDALRCGYIML